MRRTELKVGQKSLERGSTFKAARSSLPRHPMKQRRRNGSPSERLKIQMGVFKQAVLYRSCVVCGAGSGWGRPLRAHHVLYRQHLPVEYAWDPRNAMALCDGCHERHHNASRRVPLSALTDENLEFAREVLGDAAGDYLARYYDAASPPMSGSGRG